MLVPYNGTCSYAIWQSHLQKSAEKCFYLVLAKDISLGNAVQEGVGDLPCGASYQDSNGITLRKHRDVILKINFGCRLANS